jgi:hypothetical protein
MFCYGGDGGWGKELCSEGGGSCGGVERNQIRFVMMQQCSPHQITHLLTVKPVQVQPWEIWT